MLPDASTDRHLMSEHEYYERDIKEPIRVLPYQLFIVFLGLCLLLVLFKSMHSTYQAWRKRRTIALPEHVV